MALPLPLHRDIPAVLHIGTPPHVDYAALSKIGRDLLIALGEDPEREGLLDTPRRFANAWREFIEYDPGRIDTVFEVASTDQMIVVSGIRVWSYCEHHLLPFWSDIAIGYIARERVLGLSKFARIAHRQAHKLQIQERLVDEIADEVIASTSSQNVAVLARGEHLCMSMRGIRTPSLMTSSVTRGIFRESQASRDEFFHLIDLARGHTFTGT